jgi:hypothetical protein
MSDPKEKDDIRALVEALDDVPIDEQEGRDAVKRLGIDVKKWAGAIRQRVASADGADRVRRFDDARRAYREDAERYDAKKAEPKRSIEESRAVMRALIARVPRESAAAAAHFHKFEEATEEELAEMIKALRHLLNEDE